MKPRHRWPHVPLGTRTAFASILCDVSNTALPEGLWTQTVAPSPYFEQEFREALVDRFGPDGAWLILSIINYGWRAYYDLGCAVAAGPPPTDDDPPSLAVDFGVVRHLQIQGLLYAAVEQFATLVGAARAHVRSVDEGAPVVDFFTEYSKSLNLNAGLKALLALEREALYELLGVSELEEFLARSAKDWPGDGDGPPTPVVSIGGSDWPRSVMDDEVLSTIRRQTIGMVDEMFTNLTELQRLIDPPDAVPGVDKTPQSLRELDNSFRHGLRVLFNSAAPSARNFKFLGTPTNSSQASVYLPPRGQARVEFGDVDMSPDATNYTLSFLRLVSLRIGQFALAFAGFQCFGDASSLVDAAALRLGDKFPGIAQLE